jgi:hypothetical protein
VAQPTRAGVHLPEWAASPWPAHLRGPDPGDNGVDAAAPAHLTASRFVRLLKALDLSGSAGARGSGGWTCRATGCTAATW